MHRSMLTSHLASARRYGDQNLVFLAPSFLNWMRMPGKERDVREQIENLQLN